MTEARSRGYWYLGDSSHFCYNLTFFHTRLSRHRYRTDQLYGAPRSLNKIIYMNSRRVSLKPLLGWRPSILLLHGDFQCERTERVPPVPQRGGSAHQPVTGAHQGSGQLPLRMVHIPMRSYMLLDAMGPVLHVEGWRSRPGIIVVRQCHPCCLFLISYLLRNYVHSSLFYNYY